MLVNCFPFQFVGDHKMRTLEILADLVLTLIIGFAQTAKT